MIVASEQFRAELLAHGLLADGGVDGLYHLSARFESIVTGLRGLVTAAGADQDAPSYFFPPVMGRADFVRTDYPRSFPNLMGSVHSFVGGDAEHAVFMKRLDAGADWSADLRPAEVTLCSAVCHPLYPRFANSTVSSENVYECVGFAFRNEPSRDPYRMQSFRQHEFAFIGTEAGAIAHRDRWLQRGLTLLGRLGLDVSSTPANDPFFGRAGRFLANSQREVDLKFEIVAPITAERLTAIASANCHSDHFGVNFDIRLPDGAPAHTACIGFGLERIALALLSAHGLDLDSWPDTVRGQLWPSPSNG